MPSPQSGEPKEVITADHPLVLEAILRSKWAIKPEAFELILAVVQGQGDEKLAAQLRAGRLSNTTRDVEMLAGTAVIPIVGPIVPRADFFTEVSGLVSAQGLQKDFAAAIDDASVKSILFDVDSPGGAVTGIAELSQMIFEARGKKKIYAYVRGMGASAAYWALSAADQIFVSETAEVGSIGIVAAFRDTSKRDAQEGVQRIEIVSSVSPKKRLSPTTDEGRAAFQGLVDELAEVMVKNIARNRGVSPEGVVSGFGEGFMFVGQKAVDRNMADKVSTFEAVLAQLNTQPKGVFSMSGTAAAESPKTYTAEELEAAKTASFAEGAKAERKRIQDIEAVKAPGHETLVADLKFKDGMTAEKVALAVLEAQETKRSAKVNAEESDAKALAEKAKGAGTPASSGGPATEAEQVAGLSAAIAKGGNARRINHEPAKAA